MPHENVDVRIECWVKVCVDLRCWESSIPIAYHPVDTLKLVARVINSVPQNTPALEGFTPQPYGPLEPP